VSSYVLLGLGEELQAMAAVVEEVQRNNEFENLTTDENQN
jgi:hypothetical protein